MASKIGIPPSLVRILNVKSKSKYVRSGNFNKASLSSSPDSLKSRLPWADSYKY